MSTEHDPTRPVPVTPARPQAGDPPTAPVRRPATGRTEEPTVVLDTSAADATRPLPAPGSVTERVRLDKPDPGAQGVVGASTRAGAPAAPAAPPPVGATGAPEAPETPGGPVTDPGVSTAVRVGTVVWGLVLAIIGGGIIATAAGAVLDLELAAIGLLALAGLALVVGSVLSATRRKR